MPRPQHASAASDIEVLIRRFAADLETAIRNELESRLREALGRVSPVVGGSAPAPQLTSSQPRYQAAGRQVRICPVQGCTRPAAGPKYGWRCREHGATYRAKQAAKSSGKSGGITAPSSKPAPFIALPEPKSATVIPAGVQIKRLPPGPTPNDPKRAGPPMECRLPGCILKSRGPRYEFFCADHYAVLNADDRKKYTEMWKAKRAVQA